MALNIGNKVYRNLQEQVGYNTEQIKKIFSILDGIDYEDHVVVIEDISTPLNEEEMAIVTQAVSFLVYQDKLYFKDSSDLDKLYFSAVIDISGTNIISITSSQISVEISTGEMEEIANSVEVYSSEETDEKITDVRSLIANIGNASPKGVYATVSDLETAFPTGTDGIYVVSADGNWYYWDGASWTSGGVYQASQIGINEIELEKLKSDLVGCFTSVNLFDKTKIVSGYYNSSGVKQNDPSSECSTQYIPVKYGVTYKLTYSSYAFQFCTYDEDGNFIERINVTSSTVSFSPTVAFVRISYYAHTFSASFMFCDESKYPSTYQDYKLTPDIDALTINGSLIKDKSISGQKLQDDTIPDGVAEKNILSTLSLSDLPVYSVIDEKCYVGSTGTKETSNAYNSISILALQNFNIWVTDITGLSYFSLAVFNNGTWNSANFVARYRNSDNNLPTSLDKLTLNKGQLLVITYPVNNDFECGVDDLIYNYIFKNIFALNSPQIAQAGNSIIEVTKVGDDYTIKMGKYSFPFNKATNAGTYLDSYDIDKVYLNENQLEAGNILGVVKEYNQSDFMGGVQHGDEQIISMNIYCDGLPITDSVSGKKVDIYLISNFTRVSDHSTNVIKRLVHIVFENNKMTVETTFKCLVDNFNCDYAYVGMWGQYTSTISAIFNNVDEYDTDNYQSENFGHDLLKYTSYVGDSNIVTINFLEGYKEVSSFAQYVYYSDTQRLKTYFGLASSLLLNNGDELYGKVVYDFN